MQNNTTAAEGIALTLNAVQNQMQDQHQAQANCAKAMLVTKISSLVMGNVYDSYATLKPKAYFYKITIWTSQAAAVIASILFLNKQQQISGFIKKPSIALLGSLLLFPITFIPLLIKKYCTLNSQTATAKQLVTQNAALFATQGHEIIIDHNLETNSQLSYNPISEAFSFSSDQPVTLYTNTVNDDNAFVPMSMVSPLLCYSYKQPSILYPSGAIANYPLLGNGSEADFTNKLMSSRNEAIFVDQESVGIVKAIYNDQILKTIDEELKTYLLSPHHSQSDKKNSEYKFIDALNTFSYNWFSNKELAGDAWLAFRKTTLFDEPILVASFKDFVLEHKGVCRHISIFMGLCLQFAKKDGYLRGNIKLEMRVQPNYTSHVWISYTTTDNDILTVDPMYNICKFFFSPLTKPDELATIYKSMYNMPSATRTYSGPRL